MLNSESFKFLAPTLLCAILAFPLAGCGRAVGASPSEAAALPDEPGTEPVQNGTEGTAPVIEPEPVLSQSAQDRILAKYAAIDPGHIVPDDLLKKAVLYYDANLSKLGNPDFLSVINFAANSSKARFFIINMKSGAVWAIHTAHGKASDPDHDGNATAFSNTSGSNESSLGFYKTAETYSGVHGLSLRLDGLSSTNSNVRARVIVIHGASYVQESSVIQGRSLGCPAVAMENRDKVVNELKGGSLIYAGLAGK
ncbi:MAG: murein L,D-transpeptidase catalytic domain family protein [Bdellovibrionales bacterium]